MLRTVSQYLNKTMQPARITFTKEYFKKEILGNPNNKRNNILSNPLFKINYNAKNNLINFKHYKNPNISIVNYVLPFKFGIHLEETSDLVSFSTNGLIPIRWLYMIRDFHWKYSMIEPLDKIDFMPLLNDLPQITFNKIISDTLIQDTIGFKVINNINIKDQLNIKNTTYPDTYWGTYNGVMTPYTKYILDECSKFESLKPLYNLNSSYDSLYANRGGIEIKTDAIYEFMKFNHSMPCMGFIKNECGGHDTYNTDKDVTREELICLYLALKELGVNVEINNS